VKNCITFASSNRKTYKIPVRLVCQNVFGWQTGNIKCINTPSGGKSAEPGVDDSGTLCAWGGITGGGSV
jgi:hypothetical protein